MANGLIGQDGQGQILAGIAAIQGIAERAVRGVAEVREDHEKVKARVEAMPGQQGLDHLRDQLEAKIEQSNHARAEDLKERSDKLDRRLEELTRAVDALSRKFDVLDDDFVTKDDLPSRVDRIVDDREDRLSKANEAARKELRTKWQTRLSISIALVSLGTTFFLALRYIWGIL
ncbi:MAG: hypothetical protein AAF709_14020 [Pseudomonadota bacterium]